ncbi:MAG: hypothetical protein JWQ44_2933 [Chthoniobacter sp.]|nr:hypothetical protein [Chthoniobacter sp.]
MTAPRATITPAYVADKDLAALLNKSVAWFRTNRPTLEREGFPQKDRLIGLTLLADVEAWIARRRVVADAREVVHHQPSSSGINFDAL